MRAISVLFVLLVVLTVPSVTVAESPAPPPFVIIVNPANPLTTGSRKFLTEAFLKKATRWPSGEVIRPVDLGPDSPTRSKFTEDVLKRSVAAVRSYWQQMIFSGRDVPPPELPSDEEVVKYVLKNEGALGYVSGAAPLRGAKVVTVQ